MKFKHLWLFYVQLYFFFFNVADCRVKVRLSLPIQDHHRNEPTKENMKNFLGR